MSQGMTLSLCLEMLFTERPFVERMRAAWRLGYPAIEFWDWRDKDLPEVNRVTADLGLRVSTFSGNRRWSLTNPDDRPGLLEELQEALEVALRLECRALMLLADRLEADGSAAPLPGHLTPRDKLASLLESLAAAAEVAAGTGVTLLLEPLNTRLDHRGYFLDSSRVAAELVERVGTPHVRLLYDVYHMSMMGEDAGAALERHFPWLGYVHVADMPGRHEPGTGVIPYAAILGTLRRLGYAGPIGMEFSPSRSSEAAARRALEAFS